MNSITLPSQQILLPRFEFPTWVRNIKDEAVTPFGAPMGAGVFRQAMGGAGATFQPTDYPLLKLWLKSYSLSFNDGDAVSPWTDASGLGNSPTQATSGKKPTYKTNIQNGLPVVRFDFTDDALVVPSIDLSGTGAITLYAVVGNVGSGTDRVIYEYSADYNAQTDSFILYRSAANAIVFSIHAPGYSTFVTTATLTTAFKVISAIADKSLSSNETVVWIDGTSAGAETQNADNTGTFGNRASYIGERNQASLPLGSDMGELIMYAAAHTTAQRQTVQAYLKSIWGTA